MRMFPIMTEPSDITAVRKAFGTSIVVALPWPMMAAHEAQAQKNHGQSIDELARRCGLSPCEALAVLEDRPWRRMDVAATHNQLKTLFMNYVAVNITTSSAGGEMSIAKHRARGVEAIASNLCEVHFTDGFCGPRDGKCQRPNNLARPDCIRLAEGCVHAMETRGMSVVWDHDPGNHPDPIINAAELAAIKGL